MIELCDCVLIVCKLCLLQVMSFFVKAGQGFIVWECSAFSKVTSPESCKSSEFMVVGVQCATSRQYMK